MNGIAMKNGVLRPLFLTVATLLVASCSAFNNDTLPGTRYSVGSGDITAPKSGNTAIALAAPSVNANWLTVNGEQDHSIGHLAFSNAPRLAFSVDIGKGVNRNARITSGPIVAGGRVIAMDGAAQLTAVSTGGGVLWTTSLAPIDQAGEDGTGGGLTQVGNMIFASTGFGEVLAISAETGGIIWRRALGAPIPAAPAVSGDRIVAVSRDDVAYGINTKNGALEWTRRGARAIGPVKAGGGSPAVAKGIALVPYGSGDLRAMNVANGETLWANPLDRGRPGSALAFIGDVSGDPVINGNVAYASTQAGQTAQFNLSNGNLNWTLPAGSNSPVWTVGTSVFMVTEQSRLLRLNALNGEVVWSVQLPEFEKPKKKDNYIPHYGPIVAQGLVWVAGSDGQLRGFAPQSGTQVYSVEIPDGAAAAPAVAGGRMYIISRDGQLHAFQ